MQYCTTRGLKFWAALLGASVAFGSVCLAQEEEKLPVAAPTTATARTEGKASGEALAILDRMEKTYADVKSVEARFTQVKRWVDSGDEVESKGTLYLGLPDRMRCEYESHEEVVLFCDKTFYQYVEELRQVDAYRYDTSEEARERLTMLMLGFGVSSKEVLNSYDVAPTTRSIAQDQPADLIGLDFVPIRPEIRNVMKSVTVWFEPEKLWPREARLEEVSGDVTSVRIHDMRLGGSIKEKLFEPNWPKDVDVIYH